MKVVTIQNTLICNENNDTPDEGVYMWQFISISQIGKPKKQHISADHCYLLSVVYFSLTTGNEYSFWKIVHEL